MQGLPLWLSVRWGTGATFPGGQCGPRGMAEPLEDSVPHIMGQVSGTPGSSGSLTKKSA